MSRADLFMESLTHQKKILDVSPYLDVNGQRGLESSYCLLHNIGDPTVSRQTLSRHKKAQQHLKNAYSIAKALFVLVTVTTPITDLALIEHTELFPRLEGWWDSNPPTQKFEFHAIKLLEGLDTQRDEGKLPNNRGNKKISTWRKRPRASRKTTGTHGIKELRTVDNPEPHHPQNQGAESQALLGRIEHEDGAAERGSGLQITLSTESATLQDYAINPIDEETIPFHSSQLINFLGAYQSDYPHLQTICNLLRMSEPNLQLPYSLFNLAPPYIHVKLVLPPGLRVNIEVSKEFSYLFVQYLWILQGSGVARDKATQ
ncbi:hypothetical protein BGW36DRAFT_393486 [Talaromyces proteolyticus]|uniref:Uncharacterized protein n=1 Tax=Talaromyces proteolyticus TaxID=1131652 RepID=A0AAD4L3S6_9EURO|nr:uncharacterized protein BGW36DRAFT_393486 [Talaromyces proteolyticus]KAH8706065.1 hypothetical protein BGW36DRAFT_393486 [Talaromyces proteolyticus]